MSQEIHAFTEEQQAAVIGHTFGKPEIWEKLDALKVDENWFESPPIGDLFKTLRAFRKVFDRGPSSLNEILDYVKDDLLKEATKRAIGICGESKKKHAWEVLDTKLVSWAKARVIVISGKDLGETFNKGDVLGAAEKFKQYAQKLEQLDLLDGAKKDGFRSSADRALEEESNRLEDIENRVPYSLSFLNDLLYGILPSQVILLGAGTGAGKTELAKSVASHVARLGKRVHYFALEAKEHEIEQRIKFGLMGGWYKDDSPYVHVNDINFQMWIHDQNGCRKKLDPYQERANEYFKKNFSTLYTRYKIYEEFGMQEMADELLRLKGKSDLIIIDHIHYVDIPGKNENAELSKVIQAIKNISAVIKTPVICVAHIKKGIRTLMPSLEDFHGTSNLTKIALTAIMISKAENLVVQDPKGFGFPTFVRVLKCRENGSLGGFTGVCFFNPFTNEYSNNYAVGKLNAQGTKWTPFTSDSAPWWVDKNKLVTNVMEYSIG